MEELGTNKNTSSLFADWSQLPEELLHLISTHLDDYCFDVVHARSVCSSWRSAFPFPPSLLRTCYTLPSFPEESKDLCTLEKVPWFLFRVRAPDPDAAEYFLGVIARDESGDQMELLPSPTLQCSVKVYNSGSYPTLMNMLDCQIIPLGHYYRIMGRDNHVDCLPLDKEGGFVVLCRNQNDIMVLTSVEMRWKQLNDLSNCFSADVVTFKSRFYKIIVAIDPYSLKETLIMPSPQGGPMYYLVPYGNDELFLVEVFYQTPRVFDSSEFTCRVSRLDDKTGTWVVVKDLGNRVLFIGLTGNMSCSAKDLPHGCGVSGNSILFTNLSDYVIFPFKYGVNTGNMEDDLNCWRRVWENRLVKLKSSFQAFRVER
ncbi:hypothetical protein CARUB_v10024706mg [Capsella rubella]|uniref:F-box domain-containing protein n=1 Tax=Capsella rubella TaxID=81985 RepID=R0HWS4_9BRAS|nr:F-box/kelch-repeat protein At1g64840 [Capsella rubella]EOA28493.1 hypothetical protein CARUB_v10024706mg [Capsella rubella]